MTSSHALELSLHLVLRSLTYVPIAISRLLMVETALARWSYLTDIPITLVGGEMVGTPPSLVPSTVCTLSPVGKGAMMGETT